MVPAVSSLRQYQRSAHVSRWAGLLKDEYTQHAQHGGNPSSTAGRHLNTPGHGTRPEILQHPEQPHHSLFHPLSVPPYSSSFSHLCRSRATVSPPPPRAPGSAVSLAVPALMGVNSGGGTEGTRPRSKKLGGGRPPDSRMKWPKSGVHSDF